MNFHSSRLTDGIVEVTPQRLCFHVFISFQLISLIGIISSHGALLTNIVWSGASTAVFPDFIETVFQSFGGRPYETGAIYPPIVYLLFSLFTWVLPESFFTSQGTESVYSNWPEASLTPEGHTVSLAFFVISALLLFYMLYHYQKKRNLRNGWLYWFVFTSVPFLFTVERGNNLLLVLVPLFYFCTEYDTESPRKRLLSYVCLAFVVCFKIYPVLLGLLILLDKKNKHPIRSALVCIAIGLALFFIPFLFTGGIQALQQFLENILAHSNRSSTSFGLGEKVDIANSLKIANSVLNVCADDSPKFLLLQNVASLVIIALGVFSACVHRQMWKRCASLIIAAILFPSFSVRYNLLYMVIPACFFFCENHDCKRITYVYGVLLALCFAPMAFGLESLYPTELALCKLNLGTIIPSAVLPIFLGLLVVDGIFNRKHQNPETKSIAVHTYRYYSVLIISVLVFTAVCSMLSIWAQNCIRQ